VTSVHEHVHEPGSLFRAHSEHEQRVLPIELFFDLVYVFAITQISHVLLEHLSLHGAAQAIMLLLALWWAWVYTTWITNWLHPDRPLVRIMLICVMLASLGMSVALPDAFGERGLMFVLAYVVIQVGRTAFMVAVLKPGDPLHQTFVRIIVWFTAAGVLWVAGGLAHGTTRELLWLGALTLDYLAPACGYWTPGLGRSQTSDWTIHGGHLAERCQLLVIVALGESILLTGATTARLPLTASVLTAFVISFLGSVAMWWIYFSRSAEAGSEVIAHAHDPGRLGRSAYTYFHLPMVAGIIIAAVGDELTIAHPDYIGELGTALVIVSGAALYLIGHTLYKRAVFGIQMPSRIVALVVLLALVPLSLVLSNLAVSAAVTLLLGGLAAWEAWIYRHTDHSPVAAASRGAIC
jgi:low temperature requirement protein LtrA